MKQILTILAVSCLLLCNGCKTTAPSGPAVIAGKFTPPQDKTLLFIGQDSDTIADYVREVPEDNIEGITLYTQLKHGDVDQTFFAVLSPANWQSGTMDFTQTLQQSPQAALAVGLALDTCDQANHPENIAKGKYDKTIKFMIEHLKSLAPRKVFLRIGYEFDGPWNCYQPHSYKQAFRHIASAIKRNKADNIATVWQSATWPDSYGNDHYDFNNPGHLNNWYPGDDVVDWVSMSVFYRDLSQWNYTPPSNPEVTQQQVLTFARAHNKPLMIAEAAPQGYRTGGLTRSFIQANDQQPTTAAQIWQDWYQPLFDFVDANKDVIRAVAYINTHWESQKMWQCQPNIAAGQPGCDGGNWGDSRVQANPLIKQKWLQQVNNNERWVQSSEY
jgi:beta-mannanase